MKLKSDYQDNGVVRIRSLLSTAEVEVVIQEVTNYIDKIVPELERTEKGFLVREPDSQEIRNLYWMNTHSSFFKEVGEDMKIREMVSKVVPWEPILHYVEFFAKPAKVGTAIPIHQDEAFVFLDPPDFLTVWIALDRADEENGGVHYYLGSNKMGSLQHGYTPVNGSLMSLLEVERLATAVPRCFDLNPGDALFHDGKVVHFSHPNLSSRSRRGLAIAYKNVKSVTDEKQSRELFGFSWTKSTEE